MTEWSSIVVLVSTEDVDRVCGHLWDLGVSGIEEHDIDHDTRELRIGCSTALADSVIDALSTEWSPRVEAVAADFGLDAWRDHAESWRVDRFCVVPPWLEVPTDVREDELVLLIDPGHAFGSASHPTTRMCLDVLSERVHPGMAVADIGCGSGVLAIAAARLGAGVVVATDIAAEAIVATLDNVRRNDVADIIEVTTAAVHELQPTSFDLVVANIGAATLRSLAPALVDLLTSTGVLVLSGVLEEQSLQVLTQFEGEGLRRHEIVELEDWRSLVMVWNDDDPGAVHRNR